MLKRWLSKSSKPNKKKNDNSLDTNSDNRTPNIPHQSSQTHHAAHGHRSSKSHSSRQNSNPGDNISSKENNDSTAASIQRIFTPLRTIVSLETPNSITEPPQDNMDSYKQTESIGSIENNDVIFNTKNLHSIDKLSRKNILGHRSRNPPNNNINTSHNDNDRTLVDRSRENGFKHPLELDRSASLSVGDQDAFNDEKPNSTSSSIKGDKLNMNQFSIARTKITENLPFGDGSNKVFGYENFGYTCYCNSVLQCLYNIPEFRLNVLEYPHNHGLKDRKFEMLGRTPRVFNESLFEHNTSHVGPVNPDNDNNNNTFNDNELENENERKDSNVKVKSPSTTKKLFPGFLKHSNKNLDTESARSQSPIVTKSLRDAPQDMGENLKKTDNINSVSNANTTDNKLNKSNIILNETNSTVDVSDLKIDTNLSTHADNKIEHKDHRRPKIILVGRNLPTGNAPNSLNHDSKVKTNEKSISNIGYSNNMNDSSNHIMAKNGNPNNNLDHHSKIVSSGKENNNINKNENNANHEGSLPNRDENNVSSYQLTNEQRKKSALINGPIINIDYSLNHHEKSNLYNAVKDIFECINENSSLTGVVSPIKFINVLKKENVLFNTMMHQDAHEFLNFLLNNLSDYADKNSDKFLNKTNDSNKEIGPNFIKEIFEGTQTSRIKCLTCDSVTSRNEPFLDFPIEVQDNQETDIQELLQKFHQRELLCGSNKFYCNVCSGLQEAERIVGMRKLPKLLALHLKRFKYSEKENTNIKLFNSIKYPLKLNVASTFDENIKKNYELTGIVMHMGAGPQHGHYVSISKTEKFGWLLYDDETVDTIEESTVLKFYSDQHSLTTAYVLFYKEVEDTDFSEDDSGKDKEEIQKNIEELLEYDNAWRKKVAKEKQLLSEFDDADEAIDSTMNDSVISEDRTFSSCSKPARRRSRLFSFMKG